MPGYYDNEKGRYLESDWLEEGAWFEDEGRNLYIVPNTDDEIEGPDGPVLDELNRLCRENGCVSAHDAQALGLTPIPDVLKRFNSRDGYYHA